MRLRESGMNLKWISFDTYQSRDSIQLLRQQGFVTGTQSMDADSTAYDVAKTALYDGRVAAPRHEHARTELIRLERDPKTGRIDHPAGFSKDCADAMAGVIYGLTYRRDTWARHGESMAAILQSLAQKVEQKDAKSESARVAGQERHSWLGRATPVARFMTAPLEWRAPGDGYAWCSRPAALRRDALQDFVAERDACLVREPDEAGVAFVQGDRQAVGDGVRGQDVGIVDRERLEVAGEKRGAGW